VTSDAYPPLPDSLALLSNGYSLVVSPQQLWKPEPVSVTTSTETLTNPPELNAMYD
jgi:hypothetical protein